MPSLVASFFRRNVTLNMGATEEDRPQSAYPEVKKETRYQTSWSGVWNLPQGVMPYDRYAKEYQDKVDRAMREQIYRAYGLSSTDLQGDSKAQKPLSTKDIDRLLDSIESASRKSPKTEPVNSDGARKKYYEVKNNIELANGIAGLDMFTELEKWRKLAGISDDKTADEVFGKNKITENGRGRVIKGNGRITSE